MNKNAEWMGRLRLTDVECNYQEIDRQLREQFIHGLNDIDMLVEILMKIKTVRSGQRQSKKKPHAHTKRPMKQHCSH